MIRFITIIVCSLSFFCLQVQALPVESFAHLPDVAQIKISPNGEMLSSIVRVEVDNIQGTAVQLSYIKTGEKKILLFTDNKEYDISWISWKDNKTLLVGSVFPNVRTTNVIFTSYRFKTRETRLNTIDIESGKIDSPLSKSFVNRYKIPPIDQDTVVNTLPNDPDNILMALPTAMSIFDRSYPGVFKVNIRSHVVKMIQGSENHVYEWYADMDGNIRAGVSYQDDGLIKIIYKSTGDKDWKSAWPHMTFSEEEVNILGFDKNPNVLYIRTYHEKRLAVFKVNLSDPKLTQELVYADPRYDVDGSLVYGPNEQGVIGIYLAGDMGYTFFDEEFKKLQRSLDKALPNTKNFISSISDDGQKYILYTTSDIDAGTFYLGNRKPSSVDAIAYRYKALTPQLMSKTVSYNYKSRDGLDIESYLTVPKSSTGKKVPTVIFPHGGPIYRDTGMFNYWTQYFADKGYAVLRMNFRGSAGLGLEFRNAGLKNWGKEMQDDIEDGARKLIADGIADEKSICIVGASYGGYAALMGVVKTPDFYKCSISFAGVSNVVDLVRDNRAFFRSYNVVDEQIGSDSKQLKEASPVNYAAKIKVPVLLVHGDSDRQVDIKHTYQMRDALKKENKDVTFLELPNEDHYLSDNTNRIKTFKAMDEFLDKYLPVKK